MPRTPRNFPDWRIRAAYLRDPDGNLIEVNSEWRREQWSDGLRDASTRFYPDEQ